MSYPVLRAIALVLLSALLSACQQGILYRHKGTDDFRLVTCDNPPRTITVPTSSNFRPLWKPNGDHFAYFGTMENSGSDLFMTDLRVTEHHNLTGTLAGSPTFDYTWGPDSRWLYFTWINTDDSETIYRVDTDHPGSSPELLSPLSLSSKHPDVSSDNTSIVFASTSPSAPDDYDIYTMNLDGDNRTRLAGTPGTSDVFPSWSNDGQRVAFGRGDVNDNILIDGDDNNILIHEPDGSLTNLTELGETDIRFNPVDPDNRHNKPLWSEDDGELLVDDFSHIWRVDTTPPYSTDCITCSPSAGQINGSPQWFNGDNHIVYERHVDGIAPVVLPTGTVMRDADGSNRQLIDGNGGAPYPGGDFVCFASIMTSG